ncbi:MAG: DedA family protein [Deltaproteobacteria bacterium]|nr:DedA family protein [Deltaproteobacteria bacterium]
MNPTHLAGLTFLAVFSTLVVPVPEELALLGAGFVSRNGQLPFPLAFGMAFLGVAGGDAVTFFTSRLFLPRLLRTPFGERLVNPRLRTWAEQLVARNGTRTVVLARFLVGLRGPVYVALGASPIPAKRFLIVNLIAGVIEVGALVALGWMLGPSERTLHSVREVELGVAVVVALSIAVPVLARRIIERRAAA